MEAFIIKVVFSFIFSLLFSLYLTPFFCVLAQRLRFVDHPDGIIKKHLGAIPYLGGVAVYGGFLCGIALTIPFDSHIFLLIIGVTLLLLLGLIDDLVILKAYQKFFGQMLISICFLKAGFYLKQHVFYNIWNLPLSYLWILSVINAFNLVDVMDGLATSLGIYIAFTLMVIAWYLQHTVALIVLAAFLGSLLAFFWYNKPPARIYLGDAGSLFIGGFLATIPFLFDWGTYQKYGYLAPVIIFAIPLLECASLIFIRSYKRIPFYQGSPDHFSLYLLAYGWQKKSILRYILVMSLYLAVVAISFTLGMLELFPTFFAGVFFLIVWGAILLGKFPFVSHRKLVLLFCCFLLF